MTDQPPTPGSRRCMIFKHVRVLNDACDGCGGSLVFCAAHKDINREPCCETCRHPS